MQGKPSKGLAKKVAMNPVIVTSMFAVFAVAIAILIKKKLK